MRRIIAALGLGLAMAGGALAAVDPSYLPYAKPGILADVGGGRRINLNCMGKGSPTVILSAGAGSWSSTWSAVQPAVAARTRVCSWDRAGFGYSDASAEPQDVLHTTADLEKALKAARVDGPYVMVGHSLGGLETLIFTDRNPRKVAGVMLEDPSFPGQTDTLSAAYKAFAAEDDRASAELAARCVADARAGKGGPETFGEGKCLLLPDAYPDELKAAQKAAFADPAKWETRRSFNALTNADMQLSKNPKRNFASIPMIVLTATNWDPLPGDPPNPPAIEAETQAFFKKDWPRGHDRLAALSTRGVNRLVSGARHNIHRPNPELVTAAILEVVDQVRAKPRG